MNGGAAANYDLVIVGGTAGGLSVAISSHRSGLQRVRIIESGDSVAFPELIGENQLDVGFGETLTGLEYDEETGHLILTSNLHRYQATACVIAQRERDPDWSPVIPAPASDRVTINELPDDLADTDCLIIGYTDHAIELLETGVERGGRMVLAAGGMDPAKLSPAGEHMLRRLERERKATVMYRSVPDHISLTNGYPIAWFNDRRTPDLEFDHIAFSSFRRRPDTTALGITKGAIASGRVWFLGRPDEDRSLPTAPGWELGERVAEACFPDLSLAPRRSPLNLRASHSAGEELQAEYYNATITRFDPSHSDLWVLRVRPDDGDARYSPGQYATLGLGYWERRIDDAIDVALDEKWTKLIRRSYSISHRIFEDNGYLADPVEGDELEFYIVLVRPYEDHVPALTPRLALKKPGDRIYLGAKVAGRYTLKDVDDPTTPLIFFSTGTGEAPHNAMVTELLRKGHTGPIVSAVTVRRWVDLAYHHQHQQLQERFANYHYLPMPTRESDVAKRYLQNLITDGDLDDLLAQDFNPERAHVFLCGNPAMIGLPETSEDQTLYPSPTGVVELLAARGFSLDHRQHRGNIHFEEYW